MPIKVKIKRGIMTIIDLLLVIKEKKNWFEVKKNDFKRK